MKELPAWLKHATVWLLLALGLFLGVQTWQQREQATRFQVGGQALGIRPAPRGHHHPPGTQRLHLAGAQQPLLAGKILYLLGIGGWSHGARVCSVYSLTESNSMDYGTSTNLRAHAGRREATYAVCMK